MRFFDSFDYIVGIELIDSESVSFISKDLNFLSINLKLRLISYNFGNCDLKGILRRFMKLVVIDSF